MDADQQADDDQKQDDGALAKNQANDDVLWGESPDAGDGPSDDAADGLTVLTPTGGLGILGSQSTADGRDETAPVSASYAATGTQSGTSSQPDSYKSIRAEIADALGVAESTAEVDKAYQDLAIQQHEAGDAANQAIIDDALAHGRRVDTVTKLDGTEFHSFTEIIPGAFGGIEDSRVRLGSERVEDGIFSDSVVRTTRYYDGLELVGQVTSEIAGGKETITDVSEFKPGAIDLKPGDTRDIPAALTTAAGVAPSTWDPKADGTLGRARPGDAPVTGSTPAGDSSGSSSAPTSSDTTRPSTAEADVSSVHEQFSSRPSNESSDGSSSDAAAPGASTATTDTSATTTTTTTTTTEHWDSASSDADGDMQRDGDEWSAETNTTVEGNYTVEVEKPADDDTEEYLADDGYSATGPVPEAQVGSTTSVARDRGDATSIRTSPMNRQTGEVDASAGSREHARTGNPNTVWGDYGDQNDPTGSQNVEGDGHPPSDDPLILVDPDAAGEQTSISTELHDFQVSIHGGDFVNPNDPFFGENTISGDTNPQDTSPYEHETDAMAHDVGLGVDDPPP